ncbi:MAG: phage tail sheath family protein [Oscillatoria sp. SIO1A7]|nr:phage tail sheath family protein [Oscillatoria sp. SIO1A7]
MATVYLAPGVYVEEVPSGSSPIAGVGTSTAGFIGVIEPDTDKNYYTSEISDEKVGTADADGTKKEFQLSNYPVEEEGFQVTVGSEAAQAGSCEIKNNDETKQSFLVFTGAESPKPDTDGNGTIKVTYKVKFTEEKEVKLCTNFRQFTKFFGSFFGKEEGTEEEKKPGHNRLCHAVYGFFNNGGRRCYVAWAEKNETVVNSVLPEFEGIDEIAIVAAPGVPDIGTYIDAHCQKMQDRFAIIDSAKDYSSGNTTEPPFTSDYAAIYFPWIQVSDPPGSNEKIFIPPSGHIAGIYARVDTERGVHKAPANETVIGALDLEHKVSKIKQEGLNPQGINCIRNFNNSILVWGARTMGGDANGEYKYINVRRLMIYLRESIEEGTGWIVFEPNAPDLWAAIRRNITDFLTTVWRTGALFGATPEQAFYVKCDEETNPPELRDIGQVVTEIGVAVVKPAEFVIFRISQWQSGSGS